MVLSRTPGEPLRAAEWGVPRPPPSTRPASAGLLPPRAWGPGRCSSALETGPQRPSAPAVQFLPLTTSACQEGSDLHARLPPALGEDPCSGHRRQVRTQSGDGQRTSGGVRAQGPAGAPVPPEAKSEQRAHNSAARPFCPRPLLTLAHVTATRPPRPLNTLAAGPSTGRLPPGGPLPTLQEPARSGFNFPPAPLRPPSCFQEPPEPPFLLPASCRSVGHHALQPFLAPSPSAGSRPQGAGHRVAAAVQNLPQAGSRGNTQGCPWTRGLSHGEIRNLVEQGNARGPGMHGSPSRGPGAVQLPGPAPRSHRFPDMRIMDVCPDWSPPASCSSAPGPPVTPARGLNRSAEAP
ncbi:uncharacterized protein [Canis lupus baileyi]|uniref:uncharacterized protein n=1 Tax=Canis lupus baileyi TaxID=143281 RepID=UPI003B97920F